MKDIFASDIGGTNSRFAHFKADGDGQLRLVETRWLKTPDFASFAELLEGLLSSGGFSVEPEEFDAAVFAVAGPIEGGGKRSSPPYIPWDIEAKEAQSALGFNRCTLINDFVAQAFSCITGPGRQAECVIEGEPDTNGAIAVIGAGTALGKAVLVPNPAGGRMALPSEGGHTNFPFATGREQEFQDFLAGRLDDPYITYNIVVSGQGISLVHEFLTKETLKPHEVVEQLQPGAETLKWAARFYGRACRNFALETLATGGLYIAGGVAARAPELVRHEEFRAEFQSSGKLSALLLKIPVYLIIDEESGLWGAAAFGVQEKQIL